MAPQTILITGAGGFVGRYLAELWQEAGSQDKIVSLSCDLREKEALTRLIQRNRTGSGISPRSSAFCAS
jgi:thioester reductase-like protein